ncbi:hypothetical protein V1505DRAFT_389300 [Lipomyces doorenjongii]
MAGKSQYNLVTDRHKLDNKTKVAVFVGYPHEQSGYRLYDPETQKLLVSRNVTFDENRSYKDLVDSQLDPTSNTTPILSLNDNSQSELTSDGNSSVDSSSSDVVRYEQDPQTIHQALSRPDADT